MLKDDPVTARWCYWHVGHMTGVAPWRRHFVVTSLKSSRPPHSLALGGGSLAATAGALPSVGAPPAASSALPPDRHAAAACWCRAVVARAARLRGPAVVASSPVAPPSCVGCSPCWKRTPVRTWCDAALRTCSNVCATSRRQQQACARLPSTRATARTGPMPARLPLSRASDRAGPMPARLPLSRASARARPVPLVRTLVVTSLRRDDDAVTVLTCTLDNCVSETRNGRQ